MAKKKSPDEKLAKLSEDLEGLSFADYKAWKKKRTELNRLTRSLPGDMAEAKKLCRLAARGLELIGSQALAATPGGVGLILEALSVAERLLAGEPAADRQIDGALKGLESFVESPATAAERPARSAGREMSGSELASLDDAAAFLVRLDPDDAEGIDTLSSFLEHQITRGDVDANCLQRLREAKAALDDGASKEPGAAGAADALSRAGRLLEKAMGGLPDPCAQGPGDSIAPTPAATAADASIDHMPLDMDMDLMNEFIAESSDLIAAAEEALLLLETDPEDSEAVGSVLRAFHTVKGTAAFLDLGLIADLGHHAESLFSRVRDGEISYGGGYADLSLRSLDMIKELVENVRRALGGAPLLKPAGYDTLAQMLVDPEAAGASGQFDDLPIRRTGDILVAQGGAERAGVENALTSHPLDRSGEAMVRSNAAAPTGVGRTLRTQRRMANRQAQVASSVRVGTGRLDRLIDMVGELVIAFSMVAQHGTITGSDDHDLIKKVGHAGKIVREMQDISMSMRMVPLKGTFNKMARLVRDLSRKVGKNVDFVCEGEDTEIDRNLVDIINDPLVHMIRNAVDHGIETPEERSAAGKPPAGKVKLSACHSAGCVVVEIEDDGRGLDRAKILARAGEKGPATSPAESNGQMLSDREVYNMIFQPGFSTAKAVTDVSGRGVGMDVVKKNIESLRGQVEIRSEPGRGSLFRLSLPLTLAIIDGMVIRVGRETYVIPTVSIVRSVRPGPEDVSTVLHKGEVLILQGGIVPLHRLADLYELDAGRRDLAAATVVVVEDDERQVGLVVDELVGRQQVVIKSLGETMRNIPGISGGAVMPDGRVGLILDIGGLIRFANDNRRQKLEDDSGASERKSAAA